MTDWQCHAAVVPGKNLWNQLLIDVLGARDRGPALTAFLVDVAERVPLVGIRQLRLRDDQLIDIDDHILKFGQPVETAGDRSLDIEIEAPWFVEHQRRGVADFDVISLATDFGRAEQIVEISSVPPDSPAPVVAPVLAIDMQSFGC